MTPETEALIARVRGLEKRATEEGLTQPMGDELADAAPQLATALEAAEKRADAAEAKLKVAREALEQIADEHSDPHADWQLAIKTLTQLEP